MPRPPVPRALLERQLLRRSVCASLARRERCGDCGRTPLPGERVHVYEDEHVVCELCRALRSDTPLRVEAVRAGEHGHAVRLTDRRAAP